MIHDPCPLTAKGSECKCLARQKCRLPCAGRGPARAERGRGYTFPTLQGSSETNYCSYAAMMLSGGLYHLSLPPCFAFHARIPTVRAPKVNVASPRMVTKSCAPAHPAGDVDGGRLAWLENFELDSGGKVCLLLLSQ